VSIPNKFYLIPRPHPDGEGAQIVVCFSEHHDRTPTYFEAEMTPDQLDQFADSFRRVAREVRDGNRTA